MVGKIFSAWILLVPLADAFVPMQASVTRRTLLMSAATTSIPSWLDLKTASIQTPVGKALEEQVALRKKGEGSAHVHNTLRTFGKGTPEITLFRDHAGW
jgi:hypothetical protein